MEATEQLREYGVGPSNVRALNHSVSPDLLNYLDLVEPRRELALTPDGVVENLGRPLLFFVNESKLTLSPSDQTRELNKLRRALACRGERTYLARILPGELRVVPVTLDERAPRWNVYRAGTSQALTFFSRLALGKYDGKGEPKSADFVFEKMFELLNGSAETLARSLDKADVLSLVGRALFFRFLCDRQIITNHNTRTIAPRASELYHSFDSGENAASTCKWLDDTFNGDFLPLTNNGDRHFFGDAERLTNGAVFKHLGAIVRGAQYVGMDGYQLSFPWAAFDFSHVPVGLLSQVYEAFCRKWDPTSKATSVHYTPRNIAATLVSEAFDELPNASKAEVLDPACGAGVFMVLAFRRLYCEQWRATAKRPTRTDIRRILRTQLVGFDISDYALRLAALSLYLTAIELDPKPVPPEALKFEELKNRVLFNHRRKGIDAAEGPVVGSLGSHIGTCFNNRFDLVIGNPPWKSLEEKYKELAAELNDISREVLRRQEPELSDKYQNPDSAPDLPFLWKATEWSKLGGRIAMALPARILLKQGEVARQARETMFRLIDVTGIINGSNLADTRVWPKMNQPFMLLFALNQRPSPNQVMRFITSHYDVMLNRRGDLRIDPKSSQEVEVDSTFEDVWLWKALAVGTALDVEIIRKLKSGRVKKLLDYWTVDLQAVTGNGYIVAEGRKQDDASFLSGLPNLNSTDLFKFEVEPKMLDKFDRATLHRPRTPEIYRRPLVLVNVTPGEHRKAGRGLLAFCDLAYNESFNGYSASNVEYGELAVRYLHLFVHSNIWTHYTLMVSAEFGAERRKFQKGDLDECPVIPLGSLTRNQREVVISLSQRLAADDATVFPEIDSFFGDLYGLNKLDLEVIEDTLRVESPFYDARRTACRPPTPVEREKFRKRLESVIRPFFRVLGKEANVVKWEPQDNHLRDETPFGIVLISTQRDLNIALDAPFQDLILELANNTGTTRIIEHLKGGILVSILNQYRYWTGSRARLLAAEIVRHHLDEFA